MIATVLDLRRRMPEILRALERNERVTILYRGRERAVLVPSGNRIETGAGMSAGQHPACGMWADHPDYTDVAAQVRTLRQGRKHDF